MRRIGLAIASVFSLEARRRLRQLRAERPGLLRRWRQPRVWAGSQSAYVEGRIARVVAVGIALIGTGVIGSDLVLITFGLVFLLHAWVRAAGWCGWAPTVPGLPAARLATLRNLPVDRRTDELRKIYEWRRERIGQITKGAGAIATALFTGLMLAPFRDKELKASGLDYERVIGAICVTLLAAAFAWLWEWRQQHAYLGDLDRTVEAP